MNEMWKAGICSLSIAVWLCVVMDVHSQTFQWSGDDPAGQEWFRADNWTDSVAPTNPTTDTIRFTNTDTDASVAKLLAPIPDWDGSTATNVWRIGRLRFSHTSGEHRLDLGGQTLEIHGDLDKDDNGGTARILNGTLMATNRIYVYRGSTLDIQTALHGRIREIRFTGGTHNTPRLNMTGAVVEDGVLDIDELRMPSNNHTFCYWHIAPATLHTIRIRNQAILGRARNTAAFIGTSDSGVLPPDVNLYFGMDSDNRCDLLIGTLGANHSSHFVRGKIAASSGGVFEGWFDELFVGYTDNEGNIDVAVLDLREMDSLMLNVNDMRIGVNDGGSLTRLRADVWLPAGEATVGNVRVGNDQGVNDWGRLTMSNTVFDVTGSVNADANATITVRVSGDRASGLTLAEWPDIHADASVHLVFLADPVHDGLHYGLKIAGNVAEALQAADWLSVDDDALTGRKAAIYSQGGDTYVGIPPPPGSLFLLR